MMSNNSIKINRESSNAPTGGALSSLSGEIERHQTLGGVA